MKTFSKFISMILIVAVMAAMLPVPATASGTIAWGAANINGTGVRIRSGPDTTHSILTHVNTGDIVVVVERTNSEWYKVNFHGTIGYISVPFLDNSREAANFKASGSIAGSGVNMRARPNTTSDVLGQYDSGTVMTVIGINEGWYKVEYGSLVGYVRSDFMTLNSSGATAAAAPRSKGQLMVDYALGYIGSKYVWGGSSPAGFDCSGFVTYVTKQFGISVSRSSSGQYANDGRHVNKSDLTAGDLVFFSNNGGRSVTHVGIYIGNNKFVHSSGAGVGVITSSLDSGYYKTGWVGAKRVI